MGYSESAATPNGSANGTATATSAGTPGPPPGAKIAAELPIEWGLEERLAVSVVVGLAVVLMARWLVPFLIARVQTAYETRLATGRFEEFLTEVDDTVPFALTTYYAIRVIQLLLVGAAVQVLLVVWGWTGVATDMVALFLSYVPTLLQTLLSVALLVAAYASVGVLEDFVDRIAQQSDRLDEHQGEIVFRVLQVVLLATAILVVLSIWQVNLGGLLVGAGFLGIVVGMAARQTLGSMLAGFVLMFSKPFEVGDWIEVDGQEGVVTDITIVNTRLENFDGEYVVMPNDVISNSTIINRTRKGRLRVRMDVGVDYDVDPQHAREVAKEAITDVEEVMSVPRPEVVPTAFGDSSIVLQARFWIDKPSSRRRWRARAAVIQAVYEVFDEEDIGIPFPQRTLSGRSEAGFRVAGEDTGVETPSEPAED
jgi:small-conductance mechanosensitive channel